MSYEVPVRNHIKSINILFCGMNFPNCKSIARIVQPKKPKTPSGQFLHYAKKNNSFTKKQYT